MEGRSAASWNRTSEINQLATPSLLMAGKEDLMFEEDLKGMAERIVYFGGAMPGVPLLPGEIFAGGMMKKNFSGS